MVNLKNLTDLELDAAAIVAAKNERAALLLVLQHLAEVNGRKSFSPRFENIHGYAVGLLGYDSKSAWRRVNAMYLMQEIPEIAPAIQTGELDLTKLVVAHNHFRGEAEAAKAPAVVKETMSLFPVEPKETTPALTKADKLEVLKAVMSQTSREAERYLISKSSAPEKSKRPDTIKPLPGDANEVRLVLSGEDLDWLRELRGLLGHRFPNATTSLLVSAALKEAVASIKREKSGKNGKRRAAGESGRSGGGKAKIAKIAKSENLRRPGRELKRKVWNRAGGKCEICGSGAWLEHDHRLPFAKGGKTTFENLRLICRACNQRESIKVFGVQTIRRLGRSA